MENLDMYDMEVAEEARQRKELAQLRADLTAKDDQLLAMKLSEQQAQKDLTACREKLEQVMGDTKEMIRRIINCEPMGNLICFAAAAANRLQQALAPNKRGE
jgi:hypothetical protein